MNHRPTPWTLLALLALGACCNRPSGVTGGLSDGAENRAAGGATPAGQIPEIPVTPSAPPSVAEWQGGHPVNTVGANAAPADCTMKIVREWLKVNCGGKIREVTAMEGFGRKGADYFDAIAPGKSADLVVRLRKGTAIKARIVRDGSPGASLFVNWPGNAARPSIVALQTYSG